MQQPQQPKQQPQQEEEEEEEKDKIMFKSPLLSTIITNTIITANKINSKQLQHNSSEYYTVRIINSYSFIHHHHMV